MGLEEEALKKSGDETDQIIKELVQVCACMFVCKRHNITHYDAFHALNTIRIS